MNILGDSEIPEKLIGIEDLSKRYSNIPSHIKQTSNKKLSQEPTNKRQVQNHNGAGTDDNMENVVVKKIANAQLERGIKSKDGE